MRHVGASSEHRAQGSSSTRAAPAGSPNRERLHRRESFPTPSKRKRRQVRRFARAGEAETYEPARAGRRTHQCTNWVSRHRVIIRSPTTWNGLLRKEVIQPHLPVRLPCYDFTPITDPTFDGSFLAVRPPASGVADFRGVTGGVYKARERIHRCLLISDY